MNQANNMLDGLSKIISLAYTKACCWAHSPINQLLFVLAIKVVWSKQKL